ncbi:MAG: hypothetical protein CL910_19415 [Deltaproteobacteria bacterium]|jgi:hypothetical protein|nr:hypothetical protein [Deltaproteobacteria bacterium]
MLKSVDGPTDTRTRSQNLDSLAGSDDASLPSTTPPDDRQQEITSESVSAVFGSFERAGQWVSCEEIRARAWSGGVELDFREAELPPDRIVEIEADVLAGQLELTVPKGSEIDMSGVRAVFGDLKQRNVEQRMRPFLKRLVTGDDGEARSRRQGEPPLFVITGRVLAGGLHVLSK